MEAFILMISSANVAIHSDWLKNIWMRPKKVVNQKLVNLVEQVRRDIDSFGVREIVFLVLFFLRSNPRQDQVLKFYNFTKDNMPIYMTVA